MQALPTLSTLFDALPLGVVVLDRDTRVLAYNRYEEVLAGRKETDVLQRRFFLEVAPCLGINGLNRYFLERIGQQELELDFEFTFPLPHLESPRDVFVRLRSFEHEGAPYGIVFVEDVSMRKALEHTREALAALLVHDLKNPLSTVMLALDKLARAKTIKAEPGLSGDVERAQRGSKRLLSLVMNLLDVSRLETSDLPLSVSRGDARQVLQEVYRDAELSAREHGLGLHLELPPEPVEATADWTLVRRALDNLVDNALRHATREVAVSVRAWPERVELEVQDDGPGVAPELRTRIFDKFVRAEGDGARGGEYNRGLGLTLVKLVARAHGGEVSVHPLSPTGASFRFVLPKERAKRTA